MYEIWVIGNILKKNLCTALCQQVSTKLKIHFPGEHGKSANVPNRSSVKLDL